MTGFEEIYQNVRFWAKMGYFWQFLPRKGENGIFWEKAKMSLPYAYYAATLCRKISKILWPDLKKMGYFWRFLPRNGENGIFWEKAKMSLPYAYYAATLCKKPEQTYERIMRSWSDERTDERTDESEFVGPNSAPRGTN